MRRILPLVFLLSSFLLPQNVFACSCAEFPFNFCASVRNDITIVKVDVIGQMDFVYNGHTFPLLKVVVNDFIRGATLEADTFYLLGQDGVNCNESVHQFQLDEELIIGFSPDSGGWLPEEGQEELDAPVADLFGCGLYFLKVVDGVVQGPIRPDVVQQNYADFRAGIEDCVDFVNGVASPHSIVVEARFTLDGQLLLFTDLSEKADLKLFDAQGRLIRSETIRLPGSQEPFRWTLPTLPSGLYLLSVQTPSGQAVVKMIRS